MTFIILNRKLFGLILSHCRVNSPLILKRINLGIRNCVFVTVYTYIIDNVVLMGFLALQILSHDEVTECDTIKVIGLIVDYRCHDVG